MYHRFDEQKYPSTNIQISIFKEQIELIEKLNINFLNPKDFGKNYTKVNNKKTILITIDDGFQSFYEKAWPYLKDKKIPFLLFISTEAVGGNGYMNWNQIIEIEKSGLGIIGNHSHTHGYLADLDNNKTIADIEKSINIFKNKLGYNPIYFSYPFGEYSDSLKKIIRDYNFQFAFGQHSGVVDFTKDSLELPRFPINEKYGNIDRFKFILNLLPFQFKKNFPENKYLLENNNPPIVKVIFFKEQRNLDNITCYSNENNKWRKSKIFFENENILNIQIEEKFTTERGRINCSLNDTVGWRWFGLQFVISDY